RSANAPSSADSAPPMRATAVLTKAPRARRRSGSGVDSEDGHMSESRGLRTGGQPSGSPKTAGETPDRRSRGVDPAFRIRKCFRILLGDARFLLEPVQIGSSGRRAEEAQSCQRLLPDVGIAIGFGDPDQFRFGLRVEEPGDDRTFGVNRGGLAV